MAADGQRHILAIGGFGGRPPAQRLPALIRYALDLSGAVRPRVCVLNTAAGDEPTAFVRMYAALSQHGAIPSHLQLFAMPNVPDPAELLLAQDVIFVGGGSVANMIAVWAVHGLADILHQAWDAGVVLAGVSAGAICWFEGGTTDSFGPDLRPFTAGLGFLPGSYCPHYSSEPARRPRYQSLVADRILAPGIACDDGAAAHFTGTELAGIVAEHPGAAGYLVRPDGRGGVTEQALTASVTLSPEADQDQPEG